MDTKAFLEKIHFCPLLEKKNIILNSEKSNLTNGQPCSTKKKGQRTHKAFNKTLYLNKTYKLLTFR